MLEYLDMVLILGVWQLIIACVDTRQIRLCKTSIILLDWSLAPILFLSFWGSRLVPSSGPSIKSCSKHRTIRHLLVF